MTDKGTLSLKFIVGDSVFIGDDIELIFCKRDNSEKRIIIKAPKEIKIRRVSKDQVTEALVEVGK